MPVIAIGAAMYAGATIATVGLAAMSTMAIVSAVGAIASGIGVVTGNKELQVIGGVASLAGGIGSWAQGSDLFSAGSDLADGAGGAGDFARMDRAAGAADAVSNTSDMIAQAAPGVEAPTAGLVGSDGGAGDFARLDRAGDAAGATSSAIAAPAPTGLVNSPAAGSTPSTGDFARMDRAVSANTATSSGIFGMLKDVGSFMKDNKDLASLGMSFVGGMFDDKKKAEANAANASVGLYNARTSGELLNQEQQRQQMANANSVPDLTGIKIKPGSVYNTAPPPIYIAPRVGLMNSTGR